jgi:hypothetical protein
MWNHFCEGDGEIPCLVNVVELILADKVETINYPVFFSPRGGLVKHDQCTTLRCINWRVSVEADQNLSTS